MGQREWYFILRYIIFFSLETVGISVLTSLKIWLVCLSKMETYNFFQQLKEKMKNIEVNLSGVWVNFIT